MWRKLLLPPSGPLVILPGTLTAAFRSGTRGGRSGLVLAERSTDCTFRMGLVQTRHLRERGTWHRLHWRKGAFEEARRSSLAGAGGIVCVPCRPGICCVELLLSMKLKSDGGLFKKLSVLKTSDVLGCPVGQYIVGILVNNSPCLLR